MRGGHLMAREVPELVKVLRGGVPCAQTLRTVVLPTRAQRGRLAQRATRRICDNSRRRYNGDIVVLLSFIVVVLYVSIFEDALF